MEWVLQSPQVHTVFGSLGYPHGDGYRISEKCNEFLELILYNILTEDKILRTYRRTISFGQNVTKDLIPLLLSAKEDKTIELLIKIMVNLTIPVECLLSLESTSKSDFGRHSIFELNNLLQTTKSAFTDHQSTKVVIDFLKKNLENNSNGKHSSEQSINIGNCLLLLRNILHIPEENATPDKKPSTMQNQILWNIFSQSIDKVLIKLIVMPEAHNWAVTMVQLIGLLYKDQHVLTLHKLLNLWLEASISVSSEDNESNTSPPDRGSDDSSPMLTSDPTSDSSDTGGCGKSNSNDTKQDAISNWSSLSNNTDSTEVFVHPATVIPTSYRNSKRDTDCSNKDDSRRINNRTYTERKKSEVSKGTTISENSDCGYVTQIENQESISTSSNEDEVPAKKHFHPKQHNHKQRSNNKNRPGATLQERKRKKIVKRGKANIINVQGLVHKTPTDEDISNVLKEFTVDFLLKGYNSLVQTLLNQIMTNQCLEIDISHFFWLVAYFLKFAIQIELDMEHICSVLSYDIISYMTSQGVLLCEQFELSIKFNRNDLKPCIRRLQLVVTAIRELVQAIEIYEKLSHVSESDKERIKQLQVKMCETEELRSLLVLLLRLYKPEYHSKQYLQDLIVTNHKLLVFLDRTMRQSNHQNEAQIVDHIKQFASKDVMNNYGILLEDYKSNSEFINDCIFTMMHHVGGEFGSVDALYQPSIIKSFTAIWKSEFEICDELALDRLSKEKRGTYGKWMNLYVPRYQHSWGDKFYMYDIRGNNVTLYIISYYSGLQDWSDLIEYVINTFVKKPHTIQNMKGLNLDKESVDEETFSKLLMTQELEVKKNEPVIHKGKQSSVNDMKREHSDKWTEEELSTLNWYYMQSNGNSDIIGDVVKLYKDEGIIKSRASVLRELYKQNIISKAEYEAYLRGGSDKGSKSSNSNKELRDEDLSKLCEQLIQDGKFKYLEWVQNVLLDTCFVKLHFEKKVAAAEYDQSPPGSSEQTILTENLLNSPLKSPVAYYCIFTQQSIPLVPWNCQEATICKDLKFLQLLHRLGFHMPVDTGKVFIRIPWFWTAATLYEVASKIFPINKNKLSFPISDIEKSAAATQLPLRHGSIHSKTCSKNCTTSINYAPIPKLSVDSDTPYERVVSDPRNGTSWLELVQESQGRNLALSVHSRTDEHLLETIIRTSSEDTSSFYGDTSSSMVNPGYSDDNATDPFTVSPEHIHESPPSVCDTASVTSDLTRMYVSDEDIEPTSVVIPSPKLNFSKVFIKKDISNSDSEEGVYSKRPRISSPMIVSLEVGK